MSLLEHSIQALLARRVFPERETVLAAALAPSPTEFPATLPQGGTGTGPAERTAGLSALLSDELEREDRRYSKPLVI